VTTPVVACTFPTTLLSDPNYYFGWELLFSLGLFLVPPSSYVRPSHLGIDLFADAFCGPVAGGGFASAPRLLLFLLRGHWLFRRGCGFLRSFADFGCFFGMRRIFSIAGFFCFFGGNPDPFGFSRRPLKTKAPGLCPLTLLATAFSVGIGGRLPAFSTSSSLSLLATIGHQ